MRVFIGPLEVAGLGAAWVEGLRQAGEQADLVCAYRHPFAYSDAAAPSRATRFWAQLGSWRVALPRQRWFTKSLAFALQQIIGWWVLAWALVRYDAFVFLYGETITNTPLELALLRAAGKSIVVVFVGSDARPPYIDGGLFPADRDFDAGAIRRATRRQQRKVARLERAARLCINAPATAHFQRRRFVNWFALGIPRPVVPAREPAPRRAARLLHSPSNPTLKGTNEIRAIVDRLRARGLEVELVTIERRPNAEVLQAILDCDVVVDQLYSDTPIAGFAAEGACLGRAVLVGGYRARSIDRDLNGLHVPPTCYIAPEEFEAALERLVRQPAERAALGATARELTLRHWSHAAVGQRLRGVLRGEVPDAWWCDPQQVDYLHGCGLSETAARARVRALVDRFGERALMLDDKPALRQAFVAFARAAQVSA